MPKRKIELNEIQPLELDILFKLVDYLEENDCKYFD